MKNIKGELLLLITAFIWGSGFVSQKLGMDYVEPITFGAARFLLGALVLLPIIFVMDKINIKKTNNDTENKQIGFKDKLLIKGGVLAGLVSFFGVSFQQIGLLYTTAGKAGFITALYIVLVPIFGIFVGKKTKTSTWISVILALMGLSLLTITESFVIVKGDLIVLAGTAFWALQIMIIGHYANEVDGIKLSFIQFLTTGILSAIVAFFFEAPKIESLINGSGAIIYSGVMVVAVAYTLQTFGQKSTSPTVAAIIMSLESVFAVISGAIFLNESMNGREIIGCILMFIAIILAQIEPKKTPKNFEKTQINP